MGYNAINHLGGKCKTMATQGHVYFLRSGNVVKIGFSTNLRERQKSLRTARPEPSFICKVVKGSPATERALHKRFAQYRLAGEWFDLRGDLARHLEQHIYPIDLPVRIEKPAPPKGEGYL